MSMISDMMLLAIVALFVFEAHAVFRCRHQDGIIGCIEAWFHNLNETDRLSLGIVYNDAEGCAAETSTKRSSIAANTVEDATCGWPALMSLEILHAAWNYRGACILRHDGGAQCKAFFLFDELLELSMSFKSKQDAVIVDMRKDIAARLERCLHEYHAETFRPAVASLHRSSKIDMDPPAIFQTAVAVAIELGYGRRVLQWRTNTLISISDFGLVRALPYVHFQNRYFPSRVEVLLDLLGGLQDRARFFEVGVHLGRLAFTLLSFTRSLQYVGVDPYVYSTATSSASVDRQLRDLGHQGLDDARGLLEVREAAEEKFKYFGNRAELWVMTSGDAAKRLPDASIDGIFIDGDHSYAAVVEDLDAWERTVRPGGFISGHDFGNTADVARAVMEHAEKHNRSVHLAMDWVWYWHIP